MLPWYHAGIRRHPDLPEKLRHACAWLNQHLANASVHVFSQARVRPVLYFRACALPRADAEASGVQWRPFRRSTLARITNFRKMAAVTTLCYLPAAFRRSEKTFISGLWTAAHVAAMYMPSCRRRRPLAMELLETIPGPRHRHTPGERKM